MVLTPISKISGEVENLDNFFVLSDKDAFQDDYEKTIFIMMSHIDAKYLVRELLKQIIFDINAHRKALQSSDSEIREEALKIGYKSNACTLELHTGKFGMSTKISDDIPLRVFLENILRYYASNLRDYSF